MIRRHPRLSYFGMCGLEALRRLKADALAAKMTFLTAYRRIRTILRGGTYLSGGPSAAANPTPRQREVVMRLTADEVIAALGLSTTAELIRYAAGQWSGEIAVARLGCRNAILSSDARISSDLRLRVP